MTPIFSMKGRPLGLLLLLLGLAQACSSAANEPNEVKPAAPQPPEQEPVAPKQPEVVAQEPPPEQARPIADESVKEKKGSPATEKSATVATKTPAASAKPPAGTKPSVSEPPPTAAAKPATAAPTQPQSPEPSASKPSAPAATMHVPQSAHVKVEITSRLQALLDDDGRMQPWLDATLATVNRCRDQSPDASGEIKLTLTMHKDARPTADVGSVPGALREVFTCAMSRFMSAKRMPLFTGPEGEKHVVRVRFVP